MLSYYPDRSSPLLEVKGQRSWSPGTKMHLARRSPIWLPYEWCCLSMLKPFSRSPLFAKFFGLYNSNFVGRPFGDYAIRLLSCPVCLSCLSCLSCPVLSDCDVGVLWPNDWMDEDETWHAGRPPPWPHRVRWGPSSPPKKRGQSPLNFWPMSIVVKQLDGSRWHLARR